jgi:hypothetical protein
VTPNDGTACLWSFGIDYLVFNDMVTSTEVLVTKSIASLMPVTRTAAAAVFGSGLHCGMEGPVQLPVRCRQTLRVISGKKRPRVPQVPTLGGRYRNEITAPARHRVNCD